MGTNKKNWPKTVEEAADIILSEMSTTEKKHVRETKREDLIGFHFSWGIGLRKRFGLWEGNQALLLSSGSNEQDGCAMEIIERIWEKLQKAERTGAE